MEPKLIGTLFALGACFGCTAGDSDSAATDASDARGFADGICGDQDEVNPRSQVWVYDLLADTALQGKPALTGTVTALGEGSLPSDLDSDPILGGIEIPDGRWLRLRSEWPVMSEWLIVGTGLPFGFGVEEGSTIHATWFEHRETFGPSRIALTLWLDDELAFYYGSDADVDALEVPGGISVTQGKTSCTAKNMCFVYKQFEIVVALDGTTVRLDTDETAALGDYDVWHQRTAAQVKLIGPCADGFVADSTIEISRRAPP
jgi:hypothetical protein